MFPYFFQANFRKNKESKKAEGSLSAEKAGAARDAASATLDKAGRRQNHVYFYWVFH